MDDQQRVFDRWEILPTDPIERQWWQSFASANEVENALWTWQDDHPDWNVHANIRDDAAVIWEWIREEL
jgi:hypothetical protein